VNEKELLERCAAFHGHVCGGLTIGCKAALVRGRAARIDFFLRRAGGVHLGNETVPMFLEGVALRGEQCSPFLIRTLLEDESYAHHETL